LITELWKNLKMQREELIFLKNKTEMFNQDTEIGASKSKQMNGLNDILVISVDVKV